MGARTEHHTYEHVNSWARSPDTKMAEELGGSSRSSSPASDDIDNVDERDQSLYYQALAEATSSSRPQAVSRGSEQADTRARAKAPSHRSAGSPKKRTSKRGMGGQGFQEMEGAFGDGGRGAGWNEMQAGIGPGPGRPHERLLDVDYPRDFGDPVLRYRQARHAAAQANQAQTQAAPTSSRTSVPQSVAIDFTSASTSVPLETSEHHGPSTATASQNSDSAMNS